MSVQSNPSFDRFDNQNSHIKSSFRSNILMLNDKFGEGLMDRGHELVHKGLRLGMKGTNKTECTEFQTNLQQPWVTPQSMERTSALDRRFILRPK